jgi:hypothetical protein
MGHVAWLFGEAWERRRRRHQLVAWVGLTMCAVALLSYVAVRPGHGSGVASIPQPRGAIAQPPAAVFSQPPYMGVRCAVPNSIACDRVGLAIWLKRPAYAVTASIDGRRLTMDRFGDRLISAVAPRTEFDGYLRPAGIMPNMHVQPVPGTSIWLGDPTPLAVVRLLIDYGSGRYVTTHLQVALMAGWG